jgi:hypothetical protein
MSKGTKILEFRKKLESELSASEGLGNLDGGGGGPHDPGMESRVTRLETEFKYVRRDLDEIKDTLKHMDSRLQELPTKRDLQTNLQWIVGLSIAVVGLFVAVLAYLQDRKIADNSVQQTTAPAPIIIQIPSPAVPVAPPAPAPLQPPVVK